MGAAMAAAPSTAQPATTGALFLALSTTREAAPSPMELQPSSLPLPRPMAISMAQNKAHMAPNSPVTRGTFARTAHAPAAATEAPDEVVDGAARSAHQEAIAE